MRTLRNCSGSGRPARIILNTRLYERCPKSIFRSNPEAAFLVELYFDCRDAKRYPFPGSMLQQTNFTYEYFKYLDSLVAEHWNREAQRREYEHSKMLADHQKSTSSGRKA